MQQRTIVGQIIVKCNWTSGLHGKLLNNEIFNENLQEWDPGSWMCGNIFQNNSHVAMCGSALGNS
jgi:hypothetical protein